MEDEFLPIFPRKVVKPIKEVIVPRTVAESTTGPNSNLLAIPNSKWPISASLLSTAVNGY